MRFAQITIRLKPEPPALGKAEITIKAQAGVDRDGAGAGQDRRDAGLGHPDILRQLIRREGQGREELLTEHFAGRREWQFRVHGLVILDNLHILDSALRPDETDAVLVVDADGVLASAIALQRF